MSCTNKKPCHKPDLPVIHSYACRMGKPFALPTAKEVAPDWEHGCEVCGARPIMPATGLCGPCTFGEADTAGGNW